MISVGRDEIVLFWWDRGSFIILHKLYLAITCKKFLSGKMVSLIYPIVSKELKLDPLIVTGSNSYAEFAKTLY